MVAQINGEDLVMTAEAPTHRAPVVSGAEKSVQDDKGIALFPTTSKANFISVKHSISRVDR